MTEIQSFARLQAWLSPAFPTGAFSYSHGLEQAIHDGLIQGKSELIGWIHDLLRRGAGWNDTVLLAQAWRAAKNIEAVIELAELAEALSISKERHLEIMAQGRAFIAAAKVWGFENALYDDCPFPIAVGQASGLHGHDLKMTLGAYLHAYVSNQIQAALRLMKLGQQGGVEVLSALEPDVIEIAEMASQSDLEDLGSISIVADMAAMNHETLQSRIFRS